MLCNQKQVILLRFILTQKNFSFATKKGKRKDFYDACSKLAGANRTFEPVITIL